MDSEMPPSMQDTAMTQETSAAHPADTGAIMVSLAQQSAKDGEGGSLPAKLL